MLTEHAFPAIFGKQSRVNINDPARISFKEVLGDKPEKPARTTNDISPFSSDR